MSVRFLFKTCLALAALPLLALYGAWTLVRSGLRLARVGSASVRLLGEALPCPSCGEPNPLHGRWRCRPCDAVYHGFALECPLCGSGASFISCAACGISIPAGRLLT